MNFSKNIKFILDSNKKIFKIENFLDLDLYNNIQKNFPVISEDKFKLEADYGGKAVLLSDFPGIQNNKYLKKLHEIILSDDFFSFFTKFFFFKTSLLQNNFLRKLKYLRPIKRVYQQKVPGFINSNIFLDYQYSFIKNNGQIVPHVDALRKYQSLMLYFPDPNVDDHGYGTTFWESEVKNWDNRHIQNDEQRENFKQKNKIIYQTPFKANCLYGFLRNDFSWHSVEPKNINKNYVRKSININFYYTS